MSKLVNADRAGKVPSGLSPEQMQVRAAEVAGQLALLSNPNRLMVLCRLLEAERSVGALQATLSLSQSALSQHLAKLREAGMVATRREAQTIHYRIADARLHDLIAALYAIYCQDDEDTAGAS